MAVASGVGGRTCPRPSPDCGCESTSRTEPLRKHKPHRSRRHRQHKLHRLHKQRPRGSTSGTDNSDNADNTSATNNTSNTNTTSNTSTAAPTPDSDDLVRWRRTGRRLAATAALRVRRQLRRGHRQRVLRGLPIRVGDMVGSRLHRAPERRLAVGAGPGGREAPGPGGLGSVAGLQRRAGALRSELNHFPLARSEPTAKAGALRPGPGHCPPACGETVQRDRWHRAGREVGQEGSEQGPELEPVARGSCADHDPADPVDHEVLVGGVVVDAPLHQARVGIDVDYERARRRARVARS